MKQRYFKMLLCSVIIMGTGFSGTLYGALIKSTAKSTAIVGTQYTYDVNLYNIGESDSAFFLDKKPLGMTINASTGLITWTPTNINQGCEVTVRASEGGLSETVSFYIYISDAVVCDANMVSYWKLDETTGNTFTDFKGGYNAVTSVSPDDTVGVVGVGQKFNPARDIRLSVPDNANQYDWDQGDDISASVWFRSNHDITGDDGPQIFIGRLGTSGNTSSSHWWWFGLDTNNYVAFNATNDVGTGLISDSYYPNLIETSSTAGIHFTDNKWHHAVFTLEGNSSNSYVLKIYIDGLYDAGSSKTLQAGDFTSSADLNIGWWQNPWSKDFEYQGLMDEVAIYKRALTAPEILDMYNDGKAALAYCQPGNYAPLFKSAPIIVATEDAQYTYDITVGDYDAGDHPTITKFIAPAWLTSFTDNGNGTARLRGTPTNSDVGNHTITLRVSDTKVNVDQTFTIAVANTNDEPTFTSTAVVSVNEDVAYNYAITTQDVDAGSVMTISAVSTLPSWLSLTDHGNGTATLSGTPGNANVGNLSVTLKVTDNLATFTEQTFTIAIVGVNDAPVIDGQSVLSTDEDNNLVLSLNNFEVTDIDNNYPEDFELAILDGLHYTHSGTTITPEENWFGTLVVNMSISDLSATTNGTANISVNSINDLPEFTTTAVTAASANTLYEYWISGTDVEDENLTFAAITKPSWASFTYNNTLKLALLTGTPTATSPRLADVSIKITDSNNGSVLQNFTIIVAGGATAVDETDNSDRISVYPSPAKETAYVKTGTGFGKGSFQILSLTGIMIKELTIIGEGVTPVNIVDLRPGIYIYKLTENGKEIVGKIIKE